MIEIEVSAGSARLLHGETLTSGRVGLGCRLHFDRVWDGLQKTAVIAGSRRVDLFLRGTEFLIPPECLERAGDSLRIGLYGMNGDGTTVVPTVWVNCGEIRAGVELSQQPPQEQTQSLLAQIMDLTARAVDLAARLQADAERGVFNGRDGRDGIDGVHDYDDLTSRPSINSVTLSGSLSLDDLGIAAAADIPAVPAASSQLPAELGENPLVGQSEDYARADHVHPMPSAAAVGAIALPSDAEENNVLRYIEGVWQAGPENESIFWINEGSSSGQIEQLYQHIKNGGTGQLLGFIDRTNNRCYTFATRLSATKHSFFCIASGGRIYIAICENDAWTKSYIDIPRLATALPSALGTAAVGTSARSAREDHVHAMPSAADVGAVAAAQGSGNAGKFLVVGSDGKVTAVTMAQWQGGNY